MSNEAGLLNLQLSVPTEAVLAVSPHLDDHVFLLDTLRHWRCLRTKSCREALKLLREHQVAVVVSDGDLSDGTWKDLLTDLRSVPHPPRLIVTSDFANECLWAEVINYGAFDMLAKPFQTTEVLRIVSAAWRDWKQDLDRAPVFVAAAMAAGR